MSTLNNSNINNVKPLMKHEVVLPVIVDGYYWHCNEDRMWNLNELHKALTLGDNKVPSEWNNQVRLHLDHSGNFRTALGGANPGTWATEQGAIAYAMWVSPEFYLKVINAFIAIRNDKVAEAKALAQDVKALKGMKPVNDVFVRKLETVGHSLTECLNVLEFPNVGKVREVLKDRIYTNPFWSSYTAPTGRAVDIFKTTDKTANLNHKGRENGYWRNPEGDARFNKEGVKVLTKGFEWLKENRLEIIKVAHANLKQKPKK
ncbi:hypothetical protein ACVLVH_001139 [Kluyvera sp. 1366]